MVLKFKLGLFEKMGDVLLLYCGSQTVSNFVMRFRGRKQTYNGPTMPRGGNLTRKPHCSTPTRRIRSDKEGSIDGADLSEIDARLQALQDYMRDLDTGH